MNKLPVTIFMKEHILKIKNLEAGGVYAYLISVFQNEGVTTSFDRVVQLIVDRFSISDNKAREILYYFIDLNIGLDDYMLLKK